jgi:hypothetical protein
MVFENLVALHLAIDNNCPPETAFQYLDRYIENVKYANAPRFPWTKEDANDVVKLWEEGTSLGEIATYYGISLSSLSHMMRTVLDTNNISFRKRKKAN